MADELLLSKGGPPSIRLAFANGNVTVECPRGGLGECVFLLLPLGGASVVVGAALVASGLMLWIAMSEFSGLALLMSLVFGVALAPSLAGWFWIQGHLFRFKVAVGNGRYKMANGALRFSLRRKLHKKAHVAIYPAYSRGTWGYAARLKFNGRLWLLPLVPACIIGSKYEALREALKLRDWLEETQVFEAITMLKWGDISKIRNGVDYIR